MGVKVWGQGLGKGQVIGVKVRVKFVVKVGEVKVGGSRSGIKIVGSRSGDKFRGQCQEEGVKVRGRGSRTEELGSDGRWGLVGGRLEFQELMIESHSIPIHSIPIHSIPFHVLPNAAKICTFKQGYKKWGHSYTNQEKMGQSYTVSLEKRGLSYTWQR